MTELRTVVVNLPITVTSALDVNEVQDHLDNWANTTDVAGNFAVDGLGDHDVIGCTQTDDRPFHWENYATPRHGLAPLSVWLNDDSWAPNESLPNPTDRLLTTLVIRGTEGSIKLHLEAWAVKADEDGVQSAVGDDADYEQLHDAVGADGPFETLTIRGREYIIVASPYC